MNIRVSSAMNDMTDTVDILSPVAGVKTVLASVPDAAFAEGALGPGLAIEPLGAEFGAPCAGEVISVARTKHAVTLRADNGAELLIHIGLETVALDGEGFDVRVAVGDRVEAQQTLVKIDLDDVARGAKSLCTPLILLNEELFDMVRLDGPAQVQPGAPLLRISRSKQDGEAAMTAGGQDLISKPVVIELADGIHARPAAQIARQAKTFSGPIELKRGNVKVNAKSVAAMMGLGVKHGDSLAVQASGEGAEQAVDDLIALIRSGAGDAVQPLDAPEVDQVPASAAKSQHSVIDGAEAYAGVVASPGVAVGRVHIHTAQKFNVPKAGGSPQEEGQRLVSALAVVRADLDAEALHARGEQAALLVAHAEMADDPALVDAAQDRIAQGDVAGAAWQWVIAEQAKLLRATGDVMLAERASDLKDLENRVLKILYGDATETPAEQLEGVIVIAEDLLPSEFMRYSNAGLAGLCLSAGGATSHVAILAAAENVPALVALGPDVLEVEAGTRAMINSADGQLVLDPPDAMVNRMEDKRRKRREAEALAALAAGEPARTTDGERIHVFANLASIDDATSAVRHGAEGCGLLRTEFLFTNRRTAPDEAEQAEVYTAIAECMGDRPLVIRTLDIGGDKPVPFLDLGNEMNPALGLRGIRTLFAHEDIMRNQVRAILSASRRRPVQIMVPMVSSPDELAEFRAVVHREARALELDKVPEVGTMIETPASAVIADQIARVADFVSIGTNDLTQYTLAMDRGHTALASRMDALHPAVIGLIARVGAAAERASISAGVCGGLASEPVAVPVLLGLGINKLSVVQSMIGPIKAIVRSMDIEACRRVAAEVQTLNSAADVRRRVVEEWPELDSWL